MEEKEKKLKESKEKKKLMAKKIGQLQKLVKSQKEKMISEGILEPEKEDASNFAEENDEISGEKVAIRWKLNDACYAFDASDSMWHEGIIEALVSSNTCLSLFNPLYLLIINSLNLLLFR